MSDEFQDNLSKENVILFQVDFAMDFNTQFNAGEVQAGIYVRTINVTLSTAAIRAFGNRIVLLQTVISTRTR